MLSVVRWTVLFSSVIPASGTKQIDKTFIKGLLTIQVQELCKSHVTINANFVNNTANHASLAIKRLLWLSVFTTLEPPYWMFSRISEVGPNRKLVPSTSRLSFWTVWFRHNRDSMVSGPSPQSISARGRLRKGGEEVSSLGHEPKFCVSWVTKQKFTRSRFSKIVVVQKVTKVTERAASSILKPECFAWLIVDFKITE